MFEYIDNLGSRAKQTRVIPYSLANSIPCTIGAVLDITIGILARINFRIIPADCLPVDIKKQELGSNLFK